MKNKENDIKIIKSDDLIKILAEKLKIDVRDIILCFNREREVFYVEYKVKKIVKNCKKLKRYSEVYMLFGDFLYSISLLNGFIKVISLNGKMNKSQLSENLSGIRAMSELINREFQNNLSKLTTEQEEKIDSELEYLFIKLKELEDVVNEN